VKLLIIRANELPLKQETVPQERKAASLKIQVREIQEYKRFWHIFNLILRSLRSITLIDTASVK
jgi:hypothetical protein